MGQRLNLEIKYDNTTLFNAYYHWSGYTLSTLQITNEALSVYKRNFKSVIGAYNMALKMLMETEARLSIDEWKIYDVFVDEFIKRNNASLPCFKEEESFEKVPYDENYSRNTGIISFSSYEVSRTQRAADTSAVIDLANETVELSCFCLSEEDFLSDMYDEKAMSEAPFLNYNLDKLTFEDFSKLCFEIFNNDNEIYKYKTENDEVLYLTFIE